jgi:hypothetical protein
MCPPNGHGLLATHRNCGADASAATTGSATAADFAVVRPRPTTCRHRPPARDDGGRDGADATGAGSSVCPAQLGPATTTHGWDSTYHRPIRVLPSEIACNSKREKERNKNTDTPFTGLALVHQFSGCHVISSGGARVSVHISQMTN